MTLDLSLPWQVVHGDNCAFRDALPVDSVIVSDPPYGMAWNTDSSRFTYSWAPNFTGKTSKPVAGDVDEFDPQPWLQFEKVVLWGANHYAPRLPLGTTLVWVKRSPVGYGSFLSDADIAWQKGGRGVYCHTIIRAGTNERTDHPTQKPVALMEWCIERLNLPSGSLIVDPYCGSGSTGVAAVRLGHRFLGFEVDAQYADIARRRIADAAAQGNLFGSAA